MKKGLDKKGQFYMIAAVILATIILGIATISNYSKRDSDERIFETRQELRTESSMVIDYGTSNGLSNSGMRQLTVDFVNDYIEYRKEGNLYFVFGIQNDITVIAYQETQEDVFAEIDGQTIQLNTSPGQVFRQDFSPADNNMTLIVGESEQEFEIKPGENFYFVLSQTSDRGGYIISG